MPRQHPFGGPFRVPVSEFSDLTTGEPVEWSGYPPFINNQNDPNHIKTMGSATSGVDVPYPAGGTVFTGVTIGLRRFRHGYDGGSAVVKADPFVGIKVDQDWLDFYGPLELMPGRYSENVPTAMPRRKS